MSTSLHSFFNNISSNVYFVLVIFTLYSRKLRFSESSQISISGKSIFGHYEVIFLIVENFFRAQGSLFPVRTIAEEHFNEKMSSLAGLKKSYPIFRKSTDFGHFGLPRSTFKVDFLNVKAKVRKILGQFCGKSCWKNCVKSGAFYLFWPAGGSSRFASRPFPKSVILARCNFVARPFIACYACSF